MSFIVRSQARMEKILDFSKELNVCLMDRVVTTFYSAVGPEQQSAHRVLTKFQEHPDSWLTVKRILIHSSLTETKYIALQILEKLIQTRWKSLPRDQAQNIRRFITAFVVTILPDRRTMLKEMTLLGKLNLVLVQILKHEWPHNWPNFIPEIVSSYRKNELQFENNMVILRLLSEEHSAAQMTRKEAQNLKEHLCDQFEGIFLLCQKVLTTLNELSLISATVEAFLSFFNWIPHNYIFETALIEIFISKLEEEGPFRNDKLRLLTEIVSLTVDVKYNDKLVLLFNMVMTSLLQILPLSSNFADVHRTGNDEQKEFIQNIAIFLTRFLRAHLKLIEDHYNLDMLKNAHHYLLNISQVEDRETFKICLAYWRNFASELVQATPLRKHLYHNMENMKEVLVYLSHEGQYPSEGVQGTAFLTFQKNAQTDRKKQVELIQKFMELPNAAWRKIMDQVDLNLDHQITDIGNILKSNVSACGSIGAAYFKQLQWLNNDMLALFKAVATKSPRIQVVKKKIVKLVETYITNAEGMEVETMELISPLLKEVLEDYKQNEASRYVEVLSLLSTMVTKLGNLTTEKVPAIHDAVFECTLNMVNEDFSKYPEHCVALFKLLWSINSSCFPALLKLQPSQFKVILDSVVWAFKHTMHAVADTGLSICIELLDNFARSDPSIANSFYQTYFLSILQDVLLVLTDTNYKSGSKLQCCILAKMFDLVESGVVQPPLFSPAQVTDPAMTNQTFLREYVMNLLQNAFPHLEAAQIQVFVYALFELSHDFKKFKPDLHDFRIQLKRFSGHNTDLRLGGGNGTQNESGAGR